MRGVGQGTVLGGRYALRQRLSQGNGVERWSGHDATLERDVALTIVGAEHPNRAGVLDAARRAAGVEDTRLVRILDVGTESDNSYIVEETMSGSESLAAILQKGPLPAEEARRVAGETAKGLESAGQRGLHHLRLTPHHILIAPDGELRVSGVAVAAAIDGPHVQEPDAVTALRQDSISLAAVTYAALTSRWPLDEKVAGIEPAPRIVSGVVAPAEITAGVPGDLDALCRTMLNEAAGPLTPGVFANRIAPWSRQRIQRGDLEPTMALPLPGAGKTGQASPRAENPAPAAPAVRERGGPAQTEPTVAIPLQQVSTPGPTGRPADPSPAPKAASATQQTPAPGPTSTSAEPSPAPRAASTSGQSPHPGLTGQPADPTPAPDGVQPTAHPSVRDRAAAAGAATSKALGTAFSSAGAAAGAAGGKLGSLARSSSEKKVLPNPDPDRSTQRMGLPSGLLNEVGDEGPPLPLLPASTALPPGRGQSRVVVLVVAAFVGLSLAVATCGLRGMDKSLSAGAPAPRRTVTVSAPPVTVLASPAPRSTPTAAAPIAILSATGFDPEGDQKERNSQAAKVYDGDLATSWTSEGYGTVDFGGLKKGVGVILDLGQPTAVRQVTIDLGSQPVDLTVYAAPHKSLDGATAIGSAKAASGRIQVKPTSTSPPARYIIVWFTSLAPDQDQFRASISEIALN